MRLTTTALTLCILSMLPIGLSGCSTTAPPDSKNYQTVDGFAQGTTYHMVYYDPQGRDLRDSITSLLEDFDFTLSTYNPNSLISRINNNDITAHPNKWFEECFELSKEISEQTDGAFDITVGPLVKAYRIGTSNPRIPTQGELDSLMQFVGFHKVQLEGGKLLKDDPRICLDMNAIAQGYSSDLIGAMFDSLGVKDYMVEIGGEILCRGANPKGDMWRVGIDRPTEGNMVPGQDLQGIITLTDRALVTSGNYRKFALDAAGRKVTHTIDPHTARPATHNLLSATILAPTAAVADGYATACMVIGLERSRELLAKIPDLDGYLIYTDNEGNMKVYSTPGIEKHLQ